MQRIAFCAGLAALLACLAGCAERTSEASLGPPPGPFLSTRREPPIKAIPPQRPRTSWRPSSPLASVRLADIRVPGGIERGRWTHIVVHHSAADQATPSGMDHYHRHVRHWSNGLGYHFVIGNGVNYPDGKLHVGHRWSKQMTGAHCKSCAGRYLGGWRGDNYFNEHGIGICLIGNFEHGQPTSRQMQTLEELICLLVQEADINPGNVYGHGEITHSTACPGHRLNMAALRRTVLANVARGQPTASVASFADSPRGGR